MFRAINHHRHHCHPEAFSSCQHPRNHMKHLSHKKHVVNAGATNVVSAPLQLEEQENADQQRPQAYFSIQPPLEPQTVVLVGKPPKKSQLTDKMKQLIKNFKKIEAIHEANSLQTIATEIEPDEAPVSNISKQTADTTKSEKLMNKNGDEVRVMLNQLVSRLPVTNMLTSTSAFASETSLNNSVSRRKKSPRLPSFCSIAVQARLCSSSEDKLISNITGSLDGDEWMGGVRALRDSHVRLVQRQLRHIERLNRALDRISRNIRREPRKLTSNEL